MKQRLLMLSSVILAQFLTGLNTDNWAMALKFSLAIFFFPRFFEKKTELMIERM